jgi:hypothetical protein
MMMNKLAVSLAIIALLIAAAVHAANRLPLSNTIPAPPSSSAANPPLNVLLPSDLVISNGNLYTHVTIEVTIQPRQPDPLLAQQQTFLELVESALDIAPTNTLADINQRWTDLISHSDESNRWKLIRAESRYWTFAAARSMNAAWSGTTNLTVLVPIGAVAP